MLLQLEAGQCGVETSLFSALVRQLPKDSMSWISICFSSILVWSKAAGDVSPLKEQQYLV